MIESIGKEKKKEVNSIIDFLAVVSVQRAEQSNVPQPQQVAGGPQMTYPAPPVRYFPPEYMQQRMKISIDQTDYLFSFTFLKYF